MTSVREHVREAQKEMREHPDLSPARASALLNLLTSLFGSANTELRTADLAYKRELLNTMKEYAQTVHGTAAGARIIAEATDIYARVREAKDVKEEIVESIRSLRAYLRTVEEEMRMQR